MLTINPNNRPTLEEVQNKLVNLGFSKTDWKFKPNDESKKRLHTIIDEINSFTQKRKLNLVFICNHNSRRSQFAQFWGEILANHYNKQINKIINY